MPPDWWSRVTFATRRARQHALPVAVAVTLSLPLVIATVVLHGEPWAPIFDMALIEQKVRDVGTADTPLLGLIGRLGLPGRPACHPGPLGFYLLAPVYRLLGGSAWALEASAAFVNAMALSAAVFIAWRHRSAAVVSLAGVGLALLMQGYGPSLLTEPWNPNFPVLWFTVFLAAVWSVACRDLAMMPVVVTAASICAQTHIPYLPVCGALGALAALYAVLVIVRAAKGSEERKRGLRSLALALGLLFVLWLPPLIEELRASPGNASRLIQYFTDPQVQPIGVGAALSLVFYRLNAQYLVVDQWIAPAGFSQPLTAPYSALGSSVTVSLWMICALGAFKLNNRLLLALHGLVLAGIGVAILAVSHIVGVHTGHVTFWSWGLGMLLVVACLATIACSIERICPEPLRLRLASFGPAFALGAVVFCTLRLAWTATSVRPSVYRLTRQTKALASDTIEAILQGAGTATGKSGRYIVSWSDCMGAGALGIGLANELERAGFDAAYEKPLAPLTGARRTRDPSWATARIHFASGVWIAESQRVPGAVQASWVDLRTAAEKLEVLVLRKAIVDALRQAGSRDLQQIDYDLGGALAAHPPNFYIGLAAGRLSDIGAPAAVFILPPRAIPVRTASLPPQ